MKSVTHKPEKVRLLLEQSKTMLFIKG